MKMRLKIKINIVISKNGVEGDSDFLPYTTAELGDFFQQLVTS